MAEVLDVAIIGAGFGGLGMGIALRRAGLERFVILERERSLGGVWRDNHYPGAACDVPSHLYSFSFEPTANWSRRFATQPEIRDYLERCADKYELRPHLRLGTTVQHAQLDEMRGCWRITLANAPPIEARALVSACGQLGTPAVPKLPGLDRFAGRAFHSARWNHDCDLAGQRVAVIGTGASAIQFVPEIAPRVGKLHIFQRSAPYVLPKPDRVYHDWERRVLTHLPALMRLNRAKIYLRNENLGLVLWVPPLRRLLEWLFARELRKAVADPELRRKLTPDYPLGCKRVLISNDWYPALARENVELCTDAIAEVTERGIRTADGRERAVDVLIYGTGFESQRFLSPITIRGAGGRDLNEAWRGGAEAYLGMTVSGFPNFFLLYGPNTNLGHNSIIYMLESQIPYVLQCIREITNGVRLLDVRADVQRAFNDRLQRQLERTVWSQGCSSWYKNADGRLTNNWPGFTFVYRHRTRRPDFDDFTRSR